ncbi:hypothetical protein PIB30_080545 [Stylosanthes scabra]|uniref:Uncharacterized protein n=1 Tax=Stylosanthes scabra TaxID=79078 RepID=A0ABU6VSM8_9FABA|nr:hypothetical protein [Stylosanthes scabra]
MQVQVLEDRRTTLKKRGRKWSIARLFRGWQLIRISAHFYCHALRSVATDGYWILGIEKCLGKAKENIGSKGFMKRSRKREEVACGVASRLHEQLLMLRTQLFMLHKQLCCLAKVAHVTINVGHATFADSKVACATSYIAHATCSPKMPKLKARIGISNLGA